MWVSVGRLEGIPEGTCVAVGDGRAVVVRLGDEVMAFENRCLHQDTPLAQGRVSKGTLTCPAHFWRYRLPDGVKVGEEDRRLTSYPVTVRNGEVSVDLPDPDEPASIRDALLAHARTWRRDP